MIFYIFVKLGSLLQDIGRCYIYIRAENILENPYLMKNGKLTLKHLRKAEHPIEIYLLTQGCYIINISLDQGTKDSCSSLYKKIGETLFFDPNHGEYNIKNKLNLLDFLKREYSTRVDYISIYQVTESVYHSV